MNISETRVEPFAQFCDFHDSFNKEFQVSIASIVHVSKIVSGQGGNRIMQGLIEATQEPWCLNFNWQDPSQLLTESIHNNVLFGIVQVHSAIDEFICNVEADYFRWANFSGQKTDSDTQSPVCLEDDERLEKMCAKLEWSTDEFKSWRVLQYFRALRNCIAHRSGVASKKLSELSHSPDLNEATKYLSQREDAEPPPLPTFEFNDEIRLKPRHTIMALIAARNACAYVNRCFVDYLGEKGIVYLAAYYTLLIDQPHIYTDAYKSAEAVINLALHSRYKATYSGEELIDILRDINIWKDCLGRHKRVFGDPPISFHGRAS